MEMMILEMYLKSYLMVRLMNKFLVSIGKPLMEFIDFYQEMFVFNTDMNKYSFF